MKEFTTFGEIRYERPDFEALKNFYIALNEKVQNANSYEKVKACIQEGEAYSARVSTMTTVASIRHTLDTSDKFYEEEDRYINLRSPEVMPYFQAFSVSLLNSPFRKDIDVEYGDFFLKSVKLGVDSFSEKNISLMQEENELVDRYQRIMAACKIPFNGETCNLYGIRKYFSSPDREVRKSAWKKYSEFFAEHEREMEEIFDKLVKIRNEMGRNMGFDNFVRL
ncbi:MAG TPA: M3 family oligoendopeptidase, partial [Candidatus Scatosoma pullistercoris]|nr:M3 family oligoendopeptidase [Candidatus Scatosoma pullistercoris]